ELVESIKIHGVVQPGLARPINGGGKIELVIGERRWLASQAAKRPVMPLMMRTLTDVEALELQTIENDKRKDLSPIEEAEKYQQLLEQYGKEGMTKEAGIGK